MATKGAPSLHPLEDALLGVSLREAPGLLPGVALALVVSLLAEWLASTLGLSLWGLKKSPISGITVAIVLGLLVRNTVGVPRLFRPGLGFCLKKLLRLGIILLGVRLSLVDLFKISFSALPVVVIVVSLALFLGWQLAQRLRFPERLGILTAVGTSICGASAIVATAPCIEATDEEVSYAVGNITLFGLLAMFFYPLLAHLLFGAVPLRAGLFLGTAIHDTAQVTGGGLMYDAQYPGVSPTAGEVAVVVKLVRNALMMLVIPLVSFLYARRNVSGERRPGASGWRYFPVFVLGFVALSLLRTLGDVTLGSVGAALGVWSATGWAQVTGSLSEGARILLTAAMAGVGLGTSYQVLKGMGVRPLLLGLVVAALVGAMAAAVIAIMA